MIGAISKTVLSLCLPSLVLLAACGTNPATDGSASEPRAEHTSNHTTAVNPTTIERTTDAGGATVTEGGVVFLKQPESPREGAIVGGLMARIGGRLVVDEEGCLRLKTAHDPQGYLPVWPPGYSPATESGEIRVLDDRGHVAARVGDRVILGGGEIRKDESGPTPQAARRAFDERRRKLGVPGKCRGPFWWVFGPVRQG